MNTEKGEKHIESDTSSGDGSDDGSIPLTEMIGKGELAELMAVKKNYSLDIMTNGQEKDYITKSSDHHGHEHEIVLITEEDTDTAKPSFKDPEASIYFENSRMSFHIPDQDMEAPMNRSSIDVSSLKRTKEEKESLKLDELKDAADLDLDDLKITHKLSTGFKLMQEARKPISAPAKEVISNPSAQWHLGSDAAEIIKNRAINEDLDRESVSIISEDDHVEDSRFDILNWASLQREIKDCFYVIESEEKLRDEIYQNISNFSTQHLNMHLQIREATERLKSKLRQEPWKDESLKKILMDDPYEVLGEVHFNTKKLLNRLFENPKIFAIVAKNEIDPSRLKTLDYSLCNHFYQCPTEDAKLEKDLLRFITELLKVEFEKAKRPSDIFASDSFTERIIMTFLRRYDCRSYSKLLLKAPVMKIVREGYNLSMDPKNIEKQARKQQQESSLSAKPGSMLSKSDIVSSSANKHRATVDNSSITAAPTSITSFRSMLESFTSDDFGEMGSSPVAEYAQMLNAYYTERQNGSLSYESELKSKREQNLYFNPVMEKKNSKKVQEAINDHDSPRFIRKTSRAKREKKMSTMHELAKSGDKIISPTKVSDSKINIMEIWKRTSKMVNEESSKEEKINVEAFETLIKDPEVKRQFEKNIKRLQSYTNTFLFTVFENFQSVPISIRVLCKIISVLAKQKFPEITKKEHDAIFVNLLFIKWLNPYFLSPEYHEIVDDFSKNRTTAMEVSKILKRILLQDIYQQDEFLSVMNDYIGSFKESIEAYFDQLVDINIKLVESYIQGDNKFHDCPQKLQTRSLCLSLQEIETIVHCLARNLKHLKDVDPEITRIIEGIVHQTKQNPDTFGPKVDPKTNITYKKEQVFIQYFEINPPKQGAGSYIEEFLKIQGYVKGMPENERILAKCKHILKQVLLATDDISDISMIAYDDEMTIEDILSFFQERVNSHERKLTKSQSKTSVNLSSRFLLTYITKLDTSYREGGYHRLFKEVVQEFQDTMQRLNEKIRSNKMLYLRGFEMLKKKIRIHKEIIVKKHLAFQRLNIKDFLQDIKTPVCLHCSMNPKGPNKKISISTQKDCSHGRLSFMNDLGNQTGRMSQMKDTQKLTSFIAINPIKDSKEKEVHAHCNTVSDFINAFAALPLVRQSMIEYSNYGDKYGAHETFSMYLDGVYDIVRENMENASEDELKIMLDEIENYLTRKLYLKIFPVNDTLIDQAFWARCKTLEWINFNYLDIPDKNRCPELWEHCAKQIDNKLTPAGKLNCMVECFKAIAYVVGLSSSKGDSASADDTLPLFIYVILQASPRRIYSSLNFINALNREGNLLAEAGYCLTNVRSAVSFLENLEPSMVKLDNLEYQRLIHEKEVAYEIYHLRRRKRSERSIVDLEAITKKYMDKQRQTQMPTSTH